LIINLTGPSIIGQARAKAAGAPKSAINPATGEAIGPDYFWATSADVDAAAHLAAKAFVEFRRWSGQQRQALLYRLAELIEANGTATGKFCTGPGLIFVKTGAGACHDARRTLSGNV